MPEGHKSKRGRKYTEDSLENVVRAVVEGMSVRNALLTYGDPHMVNCERFPIAQKIIKFTTIEKIFAKSSGIRVGEGRKAAMCGES
ncbi:hypothetical protein RvY_02238 [Ramazzottius varieornatus]|uniref:HTH psq-type domain-containing protein n=1 Tax=Ramazzottius varieornatus TaxID=947166 RepID=A0A1D1UJ13_RAMVA|nr:hypothetical protein RvY_02238 [Ramazzottius varieornatus]